MQRKETKCDGLSTAWSDPTLSILIPTYRRPRQLGRALSSIFDNHSERDLCRIKVLIGEDASGTPWDKEYSDLWKQIGSRCIVFRNENNVGMAENLLSLAHHSRTPYSMILTDDDSLVPGAIPELLNLVEYAAEHGVGVIALPRLHVSEDGALRGRSATVFYNRRTQPSGAHALRQTPRAHILTGLLLRTESIVDQRWQWALNNAYFPMAIQYYAVRYRGALYSKKNLVHHTVENETHWHRWGSSRDEQTLRLYHDLSQMLESLFLETLQEAQSRREQIKVRIIRKGIHVYWVIASCLNESNFTYKEYRLRELKCENSGSLLSRWTFVMANFIGQLIRSGVAVTRRFRS